MTEKNKIYGAVAWVLYKHLFPWLAMLLRYLSVVVGVTGIIMSDGGLFKIAILYWIGSIMIQSVANTALGWHDTSK